MSKFRIETRKVVKTVDEPVAIMEFTQEDVRLLRMIVGELDGAAFQKLCRQLGWKYVYQSCKQASKWVAKGSRVDSGRAGSLSTFSRRLPCRYLDFPFGCLI